MKSGFLIEENVGDTKGLGYKEKQKKGGSG
jgi:hypothetical protein